MVGDDKSLSEKSKVDLVRMLSCKDSLVPHIQRVNYRMACYRRAMHAKFECPKPYDDDQGWIKTEEGQIEPMWSIGPILPPSLLDILEATNNSEDEDNAQSDFEEDLDTDDDYSSEEDDD